MTSLFSHFLEVRLSLYTLHIKFSFQDTPSLQILNLVYPFSTFLETVWSHLKGKKNLNTLKKGNRCNFKKVTDEPTIKRHMLAYIRKCFRSKLVDTFCATYWGNLPIL